MRRALLSLAVLTVASTAHAQLLEPPPRLSQPQPQPQTVRNPRAGETREEAQNTLTMRANVLGGYNRNEIPPNATQTQNLNFRPSSSTGSGDLSLRYSHTSGGRSLDITGAGSANGYSNVGGTPGPVYGASGNASFQTPLGRSTSLSLGQTVSKSPYLAFGLFDGLQTAANIAYDPEGNPLNGLIEGDMLRSSSSISLGHTFARRTTASLRYGYLTSRHSGGADELFQGDHSATFDFTQQFGRTAGLRASYRVADRRSRQVGLERHDLAHGVTGGFQMSQEITRSRAISLAVGGGAELIDWVDTGSRNWQPTYYASVGFDIARSWTASANYQRTSTIVHSPLSAPDSYLMQNAVMNVGGNITGNTDLVFNAGVTRGNVSAVNSITLARGDFNGVTAGAQMKTSLTTAWSLVVSGHYYRSQLSGAASQFLQTSGVFQRSSVRAGVSWSKPLYDSSRTRQPRRR